MQENLLTVCPALETAGWSCEGCTGLSEAEPLLAGGGLDVVVADWETVFSMMRSLGPDSGWKVTIRA